MTGKTAMMFSGKTCLKEGARNGHALDIFRLHPFDEDALGASYRRDQVALIRAAGARRRHGGLKQSSLALRQAAIKV